MNLDKIKAFVADLPWADLRHAYDGLVAAGQHPREAASAVARLVDELADWRELFPGPAGAVLEAVDYAAARALVALALRYTSRGA